MNLDAMPPAMQAVHVDAPLKGRYVAEIEMLDTWQGAIAEIALRGRTWTADPIHVEGTDLTDMLRQAAEQIEQTVERLAGPGGSQ